MPAPDAHAEPADEDDSRRFDLIEIVAESPLWREQAGLAERLAEAAAAALAALGASSAGAVLVLADDAVQRRLNRDFRGKDRPTNVLSFPAAPPRGPGEPGLGDVILAFETVAAEARAQGKSLADHSAHLAVHGILHLGGHDHEDESEAERMETLERRVLASLGIADPYAEFPAPPTDPKP